MIGQEAHVDRGDTQRAIVVYRDIAVRHTTFIDIVVQGIDRH